MTLNLRIALGFNGQCETALKFYERCLNGTIVFLLTWGNSPMAADAPPGWEAKIFHATFKIGDSVFTASDPLPGGYEPPVGFSLLLQMDDPVAAERVFQALAEHGRIGAPMQTTFWAKRFGTLVDQFGIPWTINCE